MLAAWRCINSNRNAALKLFHMCVYCFCYKNTSTYVHPIKCRYCTQIIFEFHIFMCIVCVWDINVHFIHPYAPCAHCIFLYRTCQLACVAFQTDSFIRYFQIIIISSRINGMHANSVRFCSELNENANEYVFLHFQTKSELGQFVFTLSYRDDVTSEFI